MPCENTLWKVGKSLVKKAAKDDDYLSVLLIRMF